MAVWASPAYSAGLRNRLAIHGETVRLSDLFTDLQPGQDCAIGPAPAPGKRIVVPSTQLAAIASEFGVDWQPGTNYQSVIIERPARIVSRDEILAVLKPALFADGASTESEVSLAAFVSPALPIEVTGPPEIQTLDFNAQNGRFSASLLFDNSNSEPLTLRVVGRAEQQTTVLALTHPLPAGAMLMVGDLQIVRVRTNSLRGTPVTLVSEVAGLALRRPLGNGAPLLREMLIRPMLIERGRPVVLRLESAGLALTAAGTALEAGAAGDRIHVINSLSHAILVGQIMGSADVQIDPGTAPVFTQNIGSQGLPQFSSGTATGEPNRISYAQEAQAQ